MQVVDLPGVCDTNLNEEEGFKLVETRIKEGMVLSPEGYDGFLYVGKYGGRFTDEDKKVFGFLKKIFGEDFAKQMCILVLTCGDNFEKDHEEDGLTFENWCQNEKGQFRDIIEECGNRIMLFDNMTKDKDEQTKQIEKLLFFVKKVNKKYTDRNFEEVKALKSENFNKEENIFSKVSLLLDKLRETKGKFSKDKLLELSSDCFQVILLIKSQDRETSFSGEIKKKTRILKKYIDMGCRDYSTYQGMIKRGAEGATEAIDIAKEITDKMHCLDSVLKESRRKYRKKVLLAVTFSLICFGAGGAAAVGIAGAAVLVAGSAGGAATLVAGSAGGAAALAGSAGGLFGSVGSIFTGRALFKSSSKN